MSIATTTTINSIKTVQISGGRVLKTTSKMVTEKNLGAGTQEDVQNINGQFVRLERKTATVKLTSQLPSSQTADNSAKEIPAATESRNKTKTVVNEENMTTKNFQMKKSHNQMLKPKMPDKNETNSVQQVNVSVETKNKGRRPSVKGEAPLNTREAYHSSPTSPCIKSGGKKTQSPQESNVITARTSKETPRVGLLKKKKKGPGRPQKVRVDDTPDLSEVDSLGNELDEEETENEPVIKNKQDDDNIPTVELDMFTFPSGNEQVSVLLTEPGNPNFKVYASMGAIFVGDSASGGVPSQIGGYVIGANSVVYVNPNHFLFPKVDDLGNLLPTPILTRKGDKVSVAAIKEDKFGKLGASKDTSNAANILAKLALDDKGSKVSPLTTICVKHKTIDKLLKDGNNEVNQVDDDIVTVKLRRVTKPKLKQNKVTNEDNVSILAEMSYNGAEPLSHCKAPMLSVPVPSENPGKLKPATPVETKSLKVQTMVVCVRTKRTKADSSFKDVTSSPVPKDAIKELISSVPVPADSTKPLPTSSKQALSVLAVEERSDVESVVKEETSPVVVTGEEENRKEQPVSLLTNKEISRVMTSFKEETLFLVNEESTSIVPLVMQERSAVTADTESSSTVVPREKQTLSTVADENSKEKASLQQTAEENLNVVVPSEEQTLASVPGEESVKDELHLRKTDEDTDILAPSGEQTVFSVVDKESCKEEVLLGKLAEESSSTKLLTEEQSQSALTDEEGSEENPVFEKMCEESSEEHTVLGKMSEDSSGEHTVSEKINEESSEGYTIFEKISGDSFSRTSALEQEQTTFRKLAGESSGAVPSLEDQIESTSAGENRTESASAGEEGSIEQTVFRKEDEDSSHTTTVLHLAEETQSAVLEESFKETTTVFRQVSRERPNKMLPTSQVSFVVPLEESSRGQTVFRKIGEESIKTGSLSQETVVARPDEGRSVEQTVFRKIGEQKSVLLSPLHDDFPAVIVDDESFRKLIESSPVKEESCQGLSPIQEQYQNALVVEPICRGVICSSPVKEKRSKVLSPTKGQTPAVLPREETSRAKKTKIPGRRKSSLDIARKRKSKNSVCSEDGNIEEENQESLGLLEGSEGRTSEQVENNSASFYDGSPDVNVSAALKEGTKEEQILTLVYKLNKGSDAGADELLCTSPLVITQEIITKETRPVLSTDRSIRDKTCKNEEAERGCGCTAALPSAGDGESSPRKYTHTPRRRSRTESETMLNTPAAAQNNLMHQLSRSTGDVHQGTECNSNNNLKFQSRRQMKSLCGETTLVLQEASLDKKKSVCGDVEERLNQQGEEERTTHEPASSDVSQMASKKFKRPLHSKDSVSPGEKMTAKSTKRKAETSPALRDKDIPKLPRGEKRLRKRRHVIGQPADGGELKKTDGAYKLESGVVSVDMKEKCVRARRMGSEELFAVRSVRERAKYLQNFTLIKDSSKNTSSSSSDDQQPGNVTGPHERKRRLVSELPENTTNSEINRVSPPQKYEKTSCNADMLSVSPVVENELSA